MSPIHTGRRKQWADSRPPSCTFRRRRTSSLEEKGLEEEGFEAALASRRSGSTSNETTRHYHTRDRVCNQRCDSEKCHWKSRACSHCLLIWLAVITCTLRRGDKRSILFLPFAELQLLDMPECILQHISCFMPSRPWANGPALTCRTLNELPLPVMKVRSGCVLWYRKHWQIYSD